MKTIITRFNYLLMAMLLCLVSGNVWGQDVIYQENFGDNGASNTVIASYSKYTAVENMFVTEGTVVSHYSGDGKIGKNDVNPSTGYEGASGKSAVWLTGTKGTSKTVFSVSNISIKDNTNLVLSFGLFYTDGDAGETKNIVTVQYQIDDKAVETLTFEQPSATKKWELCTASIAGTGDELKLIFNQSVTGGYTVRIDDITLTGKKDQPVDQVATPTFTTIERTFNESLKVELACATADAEIRYTTDDTAPSATSTLYDATTGIVIDGTTTIKAIAVKAGMTDSDVASATFTKVVEAPVITPAHGTRFVNSLVVSMTGNNIHYTTDGTDPTVESSLYDQPFAISATTTVKAISVDAKGDASDIVLAKYTKIEVDAVELPLVWDALDASTKPSGFYTLGVGTYKDKENQPSGLKMDSEDNILMAHFGSNPKDVTFTLGLNGSTFEGTIEGENIEFSVLESEDGDSWTVAKKWVTGDALGEQVVDLAAATRYVKWEYTKKISGKNFALKAINISSLPSSIDTNTVNGIQVYSIDGALVINTDKAQNVQIYSVDGCMVRNIELTEGENTVSGLAQGVYLMNNRKVVIK